MVPMSFMSMTLHVSMREMYALFMRLSKSWCNAKILARWWLQ